MDGLLSNNNTEAYNCLKNLEALSSISSDVYPFFDHFVEMLNNENSYIRTRGLLLIAANAKWDENNKIDEIIHKFLKCIADPKPITARQCIKSLPGLARYKPELKEDIKKALQYMNLLNYKESMLNLIATDRQKALRDIEKPI